MDATREFVPFQDTVQGTAEAERPGVGRALAVLRALGRPPELLRVSVLPVWGNKFRVNVWAAGDNGAAIPNSYFVTADDRGAILGSTPPIRKQY